MNQVRFIEESDVQRILDIYSPFVESTAISFEITTPSLEDFKNRVWEVTQTHPWLVYESENHVAGFAYASPHRSRKAYDWACEVSVYIDPFYQKRGIGPKLYEKLFLSLKNLGYYQALAGITLPNPPSEKLHKMMGFQKVGVYPKIGFKMGQWQDVIWYQKELQQGQPHSPPKTFSSVLDKNKLLLL